MAQGHPAAPSSPLFFPCGLLDPSPVIYLSPVQSHISSLSRFIYVCAVAQVLFPPFQSRRFLCCCLTLLLLSLSQQ